jgi:hypothetical protein
MTLLAGIFSRGGGRGVPESICEALSCALSRHPGDEVQVYRDRRSCFMKVDVGAYGEPAFRRDPSGSFSMLAGEPLLNLHGGESRQTRAEDLDALHEGWERDDWALLKSANGVFCAVNYQPAKGRVSLIADRLSLRPLYYKLDEHYLFFATALRVFEGVAEIPKEMDVRAVTEMVSLGTPLGGRTPYAGVSLLRPGEVLHVSDEGVSRREYWRWDDVKTSTESEPELLREVHERFDAAVGRRARGDKTTAAFLSGGLDSRCTVAALRERGVRVHTFTFALRGTQDQAFAAEFARAAGTIHTEVENGEANLDFDRIMAEAWGASEHRAEFPAERPGLVWSGDSGSTELGHVHTSRAVVDLMRARRTDAAVEQFLTEQQAGVPRKILKAEVAESLSRVAQRGIREELDRLRSDDPGRSFFLFIILKDRRRILSRHFENIDLHRLEFQFPFYDGDLFESIVSLPTDLCLGHRFYTKWLELFPPYVTSVPWQTYPGHEPCPLPAPPGVSDQWNLSFFAAQREERRRNLIDEAEAMLGAGGFPAPILKKGVLRLAALAYRAGLRDYDYLVEAARTYHKYWTLCGGNYVLPDGERPRA